MNDYLRESFSYFGLYRRMFAAKKVVAPERVSFGPDREQYFLYYAPKGSSSDKVIVWVHGGGWNAGNPRFFDYVGQCFAAAGYRAVSIGYRFSPKHKYPRQIEVVCAGFTAAMGFLGGRGVDTSKVVVAGPSAGAHLSRSSATAARPRRATAWTCRASSDSSAAAARTASARTRG